MTKMGIIIGSTRPGRNGESVARWVLEVASAERTDVRFEIVGLLDYELPVLDETFPASLGTCTQPHTRAWTAKVASLDGFIMVTPEYNRSVPGALKNAIDFLYAERNNKSVAFVSYGSGGGTRAVERLRGIAGELQPADVRAGGSLTVHRLRELHRFQDRRHTARHTDHRGGAGRGVGRGSRAAARRLSRHRGHRSEAVPTRREEAGPGVRRAMGATLGP